MPKPINGFLGKLDETAQHTTPEGLTLMTLNQTQEDLLETTPLLSRLFEVLPMARACDLHQRLQAGRTDRETRELLRTALSLCEQSRKMD